MEGSSCDLFQSVIQTFECRDADTTENFRQNSW